LRHKSKQNNAVRGKTHYLNCEPSLSIPCVSATKIGTHTWVVLNTPNRAGFHSQGFTLSVNPNKFRPNFK